ncbi:MAG: hypothetical protein RL371_12, partial [Bacteroidota bacterium]
KPKLTWDKSAKKIGEVELKRKPLRLVL